MFQDMVSRIKEETLGILFRIQIAEPQKIEDLQHPKEQKLVYSAGDETERKSRSSESKKKSEETILVLAEAERSIRSVAADKSERNPLLVS